MPSTATAKESNGSKVNLNAVRTKFHSILTECSGIHIGEQMNDIVRALVLAMLGQFHVLLFGPPGCNKSGVIRDLYSRIEGAMYFELLSSMYATKEDLVGPVDMAAMDKGIWRRNYKGRAPEANLMYVDETLECPEGLLKELHPIMNERIFHNGGEVIPVPLMSMSGATNADPEDNDEIEAFVDRFLMRFTVGQVTDIKDLNAIREMGQKRTLGELTLGMTDRTMISLNELKAAQEAVTKIKIPELVNSTFSKIYKKMKTEGINITNRRAVECDRVVRASAWLRGADEADTEDMSMLTWALWMVPKDIDTMTKMLAEYARDSESRGKELVNAVKSAKKAWDQATDRKKKEELQLKAKNIVTKLSFLTKQQKNQKNNEAVKILMEFYKQASTLIREMNSNP